MRNIYKYEDFPNYEQDLLISIINLIRSLLTENKALEANYFLQLAKTIQKNPLLIYEKLLIDFFDNVLNLERDRTKNELKANNIIDIFKSLHMSNISNYLEGLLQKHCY